MTSSDTVLIVDDDEEMRDTIRAMLELEGLNVLEAGDVDCMYKIVETHNVSLILLDLVLPGNDGLTVMRDFRPKSDIPIVILTGKADVIDKVVGLEFGADDYITKPFHEREFTARIKNVLRRNALPKKSASKEKVEDRFICFNGWKLDLYAHTLCDSDGKDVKLTSHEFSILRALTASAGRVLTRDQLLDRMSEGQKEWSPLDRSLDVLIAKVRKRLGDDPKAAKFIRTIRQSGYMFIADIKKS